MIDVDRCRHLASSQADLAQRLFSQLGLAQTDWVPPDSLAVELVIVAFGLESD